MTTFADIQKILEDAVQGNTIKKHGNFWRDKTRDQFVVYKVYGQQIVIVGQGDNSNLVKALRGQAPFDDSDYPRMPFNYPPVPDDKINIIRQWIDDGCPP